MTVEGIHDLYVERINNTLQESINSETCTESSKLRQRDDLMDNYTNSGSWSSKFVNLDLENFELSKKILAKRTSARADESNRDTRYSIKSKFNPENEAACISKNGIVFERRLSLRQIIEEDNPNNKIYELDFRKKNLTKKMVKSKTVANKNMFTTRKQLIKEIIDDKLSKNKDFCTAVHSKSKTKKTPINFFKHINSSH